MGLFALAMPAAAARLTITSYGIPHSYALDPSDAVTFDATGMLLYVHSVDAKGTPSQRQFYLGYSNRVTFDNTGGALKTLNLNTTDLGAKSVDMAKLDSITFRPAIDESGDDDGDGLTNLQELLIWHTDPRKKDSDGDGIDDYTETTLDPKVYSPLVANLPVLLVRMTAPPHIVLKEAITKSTADELSMSKDESWGSEDGSSNSRTVTNAEQIAVGMSVGGSVGVEIGTTNQSASLSFNWEARLDVTQSHEVSNEWSYDRRVSFNRSYQEAQTRTTERGSSISGATISVPIKVTNQGSIGVTLSNALFTLYGTTYADGQAVDVPLFSMTPVISATDLAVGNTKGFDVVLTGSLENGDVARLSTFDRLTVRMTGVQVTYGIATNTTPVSLRSSDVSTMVQGSTAHIEVDFDNPTNGQESPMVRNVATLTKYNPADPKNYGPVYLGEMLTQMGMSYSFDSLGFKSINGVERNATSSWVAIITSTVSGGQSSKSAIYSFHSHCGPDSVIVKTGDQVLLAYSGDDDKDGVPNAVEKFYGISDKLAADYDGDGLSDSAEIYGWKRAGDTATFYTNPKSKDTDGDGLLDPVDPAPLFPRKASHSNVLSIEILDPTNTTPIAKATYAAGVYVSQGAKLGAYVRLQVTLDTIGASCKAELKNAAGRTTPILLERDATISTAVVFRTAASDSLYWLGNDTVTITTKSLDGDTIKTWKLAGTSSLVTGSGLIGAINLDLVKPWKILRPLVNFASQLKTDPRTLGIYVLRVKTGAATSPPTFGNASIQLLTAGATVPSSSYQVAWVGDIEALTTAALVDSIATVSGSSYSYRIVPYTKTGSYYVFGEAGELSSAAALKSIIVKISLDSVYIVTGRSDINGPDYIWQLIDSLKVTTGVNSQLGIRHIAYANQSSYVGATFRLPSTSKAYFLQESDSIETNFLEGEHNGWSTGAWIYSSWQAAQGTYSTPDWALDTTALRISVSDLLTKASPATMVSGAMANGYLKGNILPILSTSGSAPSSISGMWQTYTSGLMTTDNYLSIKWWIE